MTSVEKEILYNFLVDNTSSMYEFTQEETDYLIELVEKDIDKGIISE